MTVGIPLNTIYKSESPSQAFLTLLSFLYVLFENVSESDFSKFWLSYDNMYNVLRLKAAQIQLPLPGKYKHMWIKINKMVDGFHVSNHKRSICRTQLNPDHYKKLIYPDSRKTLCEQNSCFPGYPGIKNKCVTLIRDTNSS